MQNGFSQQEYARRIASVRDRIQEKGLDGALVFDPYNVFYLGLYYHPGKRPVMLYVHKDGTVLAVTPAMEAHEARKVKHFATVDAYEDNYAAGSDLYDRLEATVTRAVGPVSRVAVDQVGLTAYRRLGEIFADLTVEDVVFPSRIIKSRAEVEMLKTSAVYSDYIVGVGRELLKPGMTELGMLNRMITATVDKMIADLGDVVYVPGGPAGALIPSGPRTALPHALPSGRALQANEPMILSCGANVWGYRTECERTFFVGSPSKEWQAAFEVMRQAQALGIELMQPGAICEEIDRQVLDFIRSEGYGDYIRHRTGHGKGLEEHETPYIAMGDKTVIQPGMIFSSEPGIYIEGMSGFRHSDIIWVSEDGPQVLTQYPKDLDSIVVSA
jgi:Xaa-Pro dipeptidase